MLSAGRTAGQFMPDIGAPEIPKDLSFMGALTSNPNQMHMVVSFLHMNKNHAQRILDAFKVMRFTEVGARHWSMMACNLRGLTNDGRMIDRDTLAQLLEQPLATVP